MFALVTISKLFPNGFFKFKLLPALCENAICSVVPLVIGIFFILHFRFSSGVSCYIIVGLLFILIVISEI